MPNKDWKQEAFEKWWEDFHYGELPEVNWKTISSAAYHAALSNIPWLPVSVEPEESGLYPILYLSDYPSEGRLVADCCNYDKRTGKWGWCENPVYYLPIRLDLFPEEAGA